MVAPPANRIPILDTGASGRSTARYPTANSRDEISIGGLTSDRVGATSIEEATSYEFREFRCLPQSVAEQRASMGELPSKVRGDIPDLRGTQFPHAYQFNAAPPTDI